MLQVLVVFHVLLIAGFTLRILLRDDLSPPARLAWFILLVILPYVGPVAYFLFGEVDIGHSAARRYHYIFAQIRERARDLFDAGETIDRQIAPEYRPAFRYAASINGFHTESGNRAWLMAGSDETLQSMITDIDAAADHVHIVSYIWLNDGTGTALAEALMRAAARGVTCRAMADGLGSRAMIRSDLWKRMAAAGVQVAVALPIDNLLMTLLLSRLDLRNHRKILVVDGRITYCGSRNAADPEFRVKARYAPWVDIMLRIEGPLATQNQLLFASDWMAATNAPLDDIPLPRQSLEGGFPALAVGDGPTERRGSTPQLFSTLIASAREKLTLTTPYFVPDGTVLEALCAAAYRGVEVVLVFPRRNDSWIVSAASRSYYRRLLEAGCTIREYVGGLLHAKTLTVDGRISLIGSTNLDLRSFDLNYENNVLLQDSDVTAAICARQADYIASSETVSLAAVLAWPIPRRVWNNVIATMGPVL